MVPFGAGRGYGRLWGGIFTDFNIAFAQFKITCTPLGMAVMIDHHQPLELSGGWERVRPTGLIFTAGITISPSWLASVYSDD